MARSSTLNKDIKKSKKAAPKVAIIMGSQSDAPKMQAAWELLAELGITFEKKVVSAHRTPELMYEYAQEAESRGIQVIIAGAGGAAHLPGMVASLTVLPVIGVPIAITALKGLDSLLSIVQMPAGIPVATVAIDNSKNAGLLAAQIIALNDKKLSNDLKMFRKSLSKKVLQMKV